MDGKEGKGLFFFSYVRQLKCTNERRSRLKRRRKEDGWCLSNKNIGIQGGRGREGMEGEGGGGGSPSPPPLNEKRGKGMRIVPLIKQKA